MRVCASCGTENPDRAKFCLECAAPLADAPAREARKTVTVVFCDVVGSTSLGESADPEAVRGLLARYFERMKTIAERHGGSVEKFIGDAVVAVFGAPVMHEDDAVRAVRAAAEMRAALPELGVEARLGVNSGEVVTGSADWLATGDPLNTAARLEQAADAGEVLVGAATVALIGAAVEVERVEPVVAKGKAAPLEAYRLVSVRDPASLQRAFGSVFVGRDRERGLLREAFEHAVSSRACHLFTLLGAAGVGKSRLVAEVLEELDATVVRGRCLSYGEGITYWPAVEAVKPLRPDERELPPPVARPLAALLGGDEEAAADEIAFAVRKLFEEAARERALVVVWDDLHWGEPTFLDLVEHVADWSRDAPILLLCLARPELLDERAGWGGGKLNATTVLLEPLERDVCEALLDALAPDFDPALRRRVLESADGNPLFVEEMVAMVRESEGVVSVPPTITALLAARIDQLPAGERRALETGSVEGVVFHRSAVVALDADAAQLLPLVRKELVRPEEPLLPGDDAFRFRHALIREAAYAALPKAVRARLHERFAEWLEQHVPSLVELDEIVGYHLEQAYRLNEEVGAAAELTTLRASAGSRLAAAGMRALERDDQPAAENLLSRARELLPEGSPERLAAAVELAQLHFHAAELERARAVAEEVVVEAEGVDNPSALARARLLLLSLGGSEATISGEGVLRGAREQIRALEAVGDDVGLAEAWEVAATNQTWLGRTAAAAPDYDRAEMHARRSGRWRILRRVQAARIIQESWGHLDTATGIERCDALLAETAGTIVEPYALGARALYRSWRGEFEAARADIRRARSLLRELGDHLLGTASAMLEAQVEVAAGDPDAVVAETRPAWTTLGEMNERGFRSTIGCYLGEGLLLQGRLEEAAQVAVEAASLASADDFVSQAYARAVRARALAQLGDVARAEPLAREAVAITQPTDSYAERGRTLQALAEVLVAAGRGDEAAPHLEEAIGLFERKGATAGVEEATEQLRRLAGNGGD
jgi:class 3 adenylate cyclase/predicted ATPase